MLSGWWHLRAISSNSMTPSRSETQHTTAVAIYPSCFTILIFLNVTSDCKWECEKLIEKISLNLLHLVAAWFHVSSDPLWTIFFSPSEQSVSKLFIYHPHGQWNEGFSSCLFHAHSQHNQTTTTGGITSHSMLLTHPLTDIFRDEKFNFHLFPV